MVDNRQVLFALVCAALLAGACGAAGRPFRLTSSDLPPNRPISERHIANAWGCHGNEESPSLQWSGAPPGTRSFAITMYDSAKPPTSGWWHWIVYDLPSTVSDLPRGSGNPGSAGLPAGAKQGLPDGDAPEPRYYGPCPAAGAPPHNYLITVYALNVDRLDLPATATAAYIDYVITTKAIAKSSMVRSYHRTSS